MASRGAGSVPCYPRAMDELHAAGGVVAIALFLGVVGVCAGLAVAQRSPRWLDLVWKAAHGWLVAQVIVGAILLFGGDRPAEVLHFVYAAAALGALPLASAFAAEAPPRARAAVLALASLITAFLAWRLTATG